MRRLFLLIPALLFTACDSGDDGPVTRVEITAITVDGYPLVGPDDGDWDNGIGQGSADVYVRAQLNGITVADNRDSDFEDISIDDLPAELNLRGGFTINQLSGDLTFEMVDRDGGAASEDPVMAETQSASLAALVEAQTPVRSFASNGAQGARADLRVTFGYR